MAIKFSALELFRRKAHCCDSWKREAFAICICSLFVICVLWKKCEGGGVISNPKNIIVNLRKLAHIYEKSAVKNSKI